MSVIIDHSKKKSAPSLSVIRLSCMMLATNESHTREPTYDNAQYKISKKTLQFIRTCLTKHC